MQENQDDPVLACRPATETSAALSAARPLIAANIAVTEAALAELAITRGDALLSDPAAVRTVDARIADAGLTLERLLALQSAVDRRLPDLVKQEKVAAVRALVEKANTATAAVCARYRAEYIIAATVIASILADDSAAASARGAAVYDYMRDPDLMRQAGIALPNSPDVLPVGYTDGRGYPGLILHLPGVNPPGEVLRAEYSRLWPPAATPPSPQPPVASPQPTTPYVRAPVIEFAGPVPSNFTLIG